MTINQKQNKPRLILEEELQSKEHSDERLKKVLFAMHKSLVTLDLIHDKVINKNFEAQTVVNNLTEQA
jgi:hypothetical protein